MLAWCEISLIDYNAYILSLQKASLVSGMSQYKAWLNGREGA